MTVEEIFLAEAAGKLAENVSRIEACVPKLAPALLWARESENENAVGNLLLHLEGNVRQWILAGVGGAPASMMAASSISRSTRRSSSSVSR